MTDHLAIELRQLSVETPAVTDHDRDRGDLAAELTRAREARGWTQKELADLLGTTEETVSNWERGKVRRPRGLDRIRSVLGIAESNAEGEPPVHRLTDDQLWRRLRETLAETERRFYLRQPNPGPELRYGTRAHVPPHLTGEAAKRLSSER